MQDNKGQQEEIHRVLGEVTWKHAVRICWGWGGRADPTKGHSGSNTRDKKEAIVGGSEVTSWLEFQEVGWNEQLTQDLYVVSRDAL